MSPAPSGYFFGVEGILDGSWRLLPKLPRDDLPEGNSRGRKPAVFRPRLPRPEISASQVRTPPLCGCGACRVRDQSHPSGRSIMILKTVKYGLLTATCVASNAVRDSVPNLLK